MAVPDEIVVWFKSIFADANRHLSEKMLNVPGIPEPHLDTTLIAHLMSYASPRRFQGDWAVRIDVHFIGGLAQFQHWEIADIGIFIFFQQKGVLVRQKVALLQSKRLYPLTGEVQELEDFDYMVGLARLGARHGHQAPILAARSFRFTTRSAYQALKSQDRQSERIKEFMQRNDIPLFYMLYNPPRVPLTVSTPLNRYHRLRADPVLGVRIVAASEMLMGLTTVSPWPTLADVDQFLDPADGSLHTGGWRLEYFITDLLLRCHEGKRFTSADDDNLFEIFNRRSGPIAATIAVTVEMPDGAELPG
jgi:hypothetical protein